jgi:uncharacterized protein with FMN-binding domain
MPPKNVTRAAGTVLVALSLSACSPGTQTSDTTSSAEATPRNPNTSASPTATAAAEFRDGEYTATGWYGSAPSHHDVTLTIDDNTITAVDITTPAENETSLGYQQRFAAALPDVIIGRNIADLTIDKVAGSSGCSEGFMDALNKIKKQAAL